MSRFIQLLNNRVIRVIDKWSESESDRNNSKFEEWSLKLRAKTAALLGSVRNIRVNRVIRVIRVIKIIRVNWIIRVHSIMSKNSKRHQRIEQRRVGGYRPLTQ